MEFRDRPGTKGILDKVPKGEKRAANRLGKGHQTQKDGIERAVGAQQCFLPKEIHIQPADGLMTTACDSKIQRQDVN